MAGAKYALDFYPQYAWDWAPVSDSSALYNGDLVGLAFNRADGRYYSAVLMEGVDGVQEYYRTVPLERRKAKRLGLWGMSISPLATAGSPISIRFGK